MSAPHVLLVEDNEDDVFALRWALGKLDLPAKLSLATDGQQALDFLATVLAQPTEGMPDVVLLDLKLPFISGHEILEWIRAQKEFDRVRVVILSGSDEAKDHARAESSGANGYLVKPATPNQLREVLARS